jgi:hypothetical protein
LFRPLTPSQFLEVRDDLPGDVFLPSDADERQVVVAGHVETAPSFTSQPPKLSGSNSRERRRDVREECSACDQERSDASSVWDSHPLISGLRLAFQAVRSNF